MIYEEDGKRVFARDGFGALGRYYFIPFAFSVCIIACLCVLGFWAVLFYYGPLGTRWPLLNLVDWIALLMLCITVIYLPFHLIESVWRITTGHLALILEKDRAKARGLFGGPLTFEYDSMRCVRPMKSIRGRMAFVLEDDQGRLIKPVMSEAGQLIEELLPRLSALEHIEIPEDYLKPRYWGKEPNWDIINAAIARAEANRKKKEQ